MDENLIGQHNLSELENTTMDSTMRDWTNLPSELLSLILSHLLLYDIKRFRNVCKTWQLVTSQKVVPSPIHCPITQSHWLMFFLGYKVPLNFYNPLYEDTYQMVIPPELSSAMLRFSNNGWLLMSRGKYSMFFFNPFTNAKIDLPDLREYYYFDTISFSSVATSSDCTLFAILSLLNDIVWFSSISRGEESWTWAIVNSNLNFQPSHTNPVFYNELFYCLGQDCNLRVFNPKEEDSSWTVLDGLEKPHGCDSVYESYLKECDGKLLSVFVGNRGRGVSVYTLDELEMAWQRVTDLGSEMLFVSHTTSFSSTKVVEGMENKIYFPRFCGKDGVFYCLATNRCGSFHSNIRKADLCGTEEQLHCIWIEPITRTYSE
ncbi:F-box/kelch-repeat protein At1g57790-like [Camellia sinensis]|uniref:F-box/kelch-repeat protein At1g57790-like n=1 Tax=Camellia sinensis TaxID=4442 RepID=UPI001036E3F4|nr:F-box/kelch-repeat protein At1g57790-like [Camellia sinensis]